jgi:hypothetical protein
MYGTDIRERAVALPKRDQGMYRLMLKGIVVKHEDPVSQLTVNVRTNKAQQTAEVSQMKDEILNNQGAERNLLGETNQSTKD